jgi:hypothetical protein
MKESERLRIEAQKHRDEAKRSSWSFSGQLSFLKMAAQYEQAAAMAAIAEALNTPEPPKS